MRDPTAIDAREFVQLLRQMEGGIEMIVGGGGGVGKGWRKETPIVCLHAEQRLL